MGFWSFSAALKLLFYGITFDKSSETKAGFAGEQPARDKSDRFHDSAP